MLLAFVIKGFIPLSTPTLFQRAPHRQFVPSYDITFGYFSVCKFANPHRVMLAITAVNHFLHSFSSFSGHQTGLFLVQTGFKILSSANTQMTPLATTKPRQSAQLFGISILIFIIIIFLYSYMTHDI